MAKVVEFFGLPGAGKTTLCGYLIDSLLERNIKVISYLDYRRKLPKYIVALVRIKAIAQMLKDFRLIIGYKKRTGGLTIDSLKRLSVIYQRINFIDHFTGDDTYDLIVIDQWIVQELWSLSANEQSIDKLLFAKTIEKLADSSVFFVFCDAGIDICAARIADRLHGASRFEGDDIAEVGEKLSPLVLNMANFHSMVTDKCPTVCYLNTDKPAHENAQDLSQKILTFLQSNLL